VVAMFLIIFAILMFAACCIWPVYANNFEYIELRLLDNIDIIIYILPAIVILALTRNFKIFWLGLKVAAVPKKDISESMLNQAITLFRFLSKITVLTIIIWFFFSLVNILFEFSLNLFDAEFFIDPNPTPYSNYDAVYAINFLSVQLAYQFYCMLKGLFLIIGIYEPVVFMLKQRKHKEEA